MEAARSRGKHVGRPETPAELVFRIEELARDTDLSISQIKDAVQGKVSRSVVGRIVKQVRDQQEAGAL